ncbi:MAG: hypothetical protein QME52_07985 [Bacteroidota bacterium]|nr:hypothetical protein [Bacteroidota bacterium]
MNVLRQIINVQDGQILIELPKDFQAKEVEIIIISVEREDTTRKQKYDFSDLVGKLQWNGDPLIEQRQIRNEWQ